MINKRRRVSLNMAALQCLFTTVCLVLLFHFSWCLSPFGYKEFNPQMGETVKLSIHIPKEDNFTTSLAAVGEAIQLRRRLATLYDKDNEEFIYLKFDTNNTLELVRSPLLFGSNMSSNIGKPVNRPECVYTSTNTLVGAVLDLCSGVKGYFEHGHFVSYIQPDRSPYSNTLRHVIITELDHEEYNDTDEWESISEELSATFAKKTRLKRHAFPRRYMEVYVIADFDYGRFRCAKTASICKRKIIRTLRVASLILKQNFNLLVVMTAYEYWQTKANNIAHDIETTKFTIDGEEFRKSINAFTSESNIRRLRAKAPFDVLLFMTSTWPGLNLHGTQVGFSYVGRACFRSLNYAVVDSGRGPKAAVATTVHELIHTVGGKHCGSGFMENSTYCVRCDKSIQQCTLDKLKKTLRLMPCLNNYPEPTLHECGNTIIDAGEECEFLPGDADDSNLCCDFDCKTIDGAYCAGGDCCIISSCSYKTKGTLCREYVHGEACRGRCTGSSGECPQDDGSCFDVVWNEWRQWSPCECITAAVRQVRNRTCRYPFNYQKNHMCLQVGAEERGQCQAVPGCRDGNWGAWHQWGRCECFGDVLQHRYKECDDPPPTNGGLNCVGVAPKESRACVTDECDNQPTEPRRTQAVTGPNDITTRTPMTQQSTVPGGLITDPDPATYDTGGVESTTLPHDLLPEASTAINVFVASVSSNISIVGATLLGLLVLTLLLVAARKLINWRKATKKRKKRFEFGGTDATMVVRPFGILSTIMALSQSSRKASRSTAAEVKRSVKPKPDKVDALSSKRKKSSKQQSHNGKIKPTTE